MTQTLAPIVLFVYNRPEHTRKTIEALRANRLASDSRLFIFSDGAKNEAAKPQVQQVREYIRSIDGFASIEIIEREENWGLARSVIAGVTQIVNDYGKIIVLEDDLVTSPYFLDYMNEGLELYKDEPEVASVNAYIYTLDLSSLPETYFLPFVDCWGWGTWQRAWKDFENDAGSLLRKIKAQKLTKAFDLDGTCNNTNMLKQQSEGAIDSWAICWLASNFFLNRKGLYPAVPFVKNIGLDGTGVHFNKNTQQDLINFYNRDLADSFKYLKRIPISINIEVLEAYKRFSAKTYQSNIFIRALLKLRCFLSSKLSL